MPYQRSRDAAQVTGTQSTSTQALSGMNAPVGLGDPFAVALDQAVLKLVP